MELTAGDLGLDGFQLVVDDDGTGVGAVRECDETDNSVTWTDIGCSGGRPGRPISPGSGEPPTDRSPWTTVYDRDG